MSRELKRTFLIEKNEKKKCLEFALRAVTGKYQSLKDFGSRRERERADQVADTAQGKMGEMCFQKFLKHNFGFCFEPDFQHYPDQMEIDFGSDIEEAKAGRHRGVCTVRLDVKSMRSYAKWLLVEKHKFWSSVYVCVKLNLPRDFEKNPVACLDQAVKGGTAGFAYSADLIDPKTKNPWFKFQQGEGLPHPNALKGIPRIPKKIWEFCRNLPDSKKLQVGLKARVNYGLPVGWMRNSSSEWRKLSSILTTSLVQRMRFPFPAVQLSTSHF